MNVWWTEQENNGKSSDYYIDSPAITAHEYVEEVQNDSSTWTKKLIKWN